MSANMVEVRIGGLSIRVPAHGSKEETQALVDRVNSRLQELEAASTKVNTQAFALQAAYEFARESDRIRQEAADTQLDLLGALQDLTGRIEAFREQVVESTESGRQ